MKLTIAVVLLVVAGLPAQTQSDKEHAALLLGFKSGQLTGAYQEYLHLKKPPSLLPVLCEQRRQLNKTMEDDLLRRLVQDVLYIQGVKADSNYLSDLQEECR